MNEPDGNQQSLCIICGIVACVLLLAGSVTFADANDGEYLGYRLGDKYPIPKRTAVRPHITGALIFDLNPGEHPHHVDTISLYVSPTSSIVGSIFGEWYFSNERAAESFADRYLAKLHGKYPNWMRTGRSLTYGDYQLWASVEKRPPVAEHWLSPKGYRVRLAGCSKTI